MTRISIVTPCYNAERYIGSTAESVLAQTFSDFEYIIVDDGSSDDSAGAASAAIRSDSRARLITQDNGGVSAARLTGFAATDPTSDYLVFLDADDIVDPSFLETLASHLDAHPDVGFAYCGQRDIDTAGNPIGDEHHKPRFVRDGLRIRELDPSEAATPLDVIVSRFEAIPSTAMFRRSTFEATGGWKKAGVTEDKDIGIRMALLAPVHHIAQNLTSYRHHDGQRHLDGFYASMDALHRQWWDDDTLGTDERRQVRDALIFDRRVAAYLTRKEVVAAARSEPKHAVRLTLRSLKQTAQAVSLWVRKRTR